ALVPSASHRTNMGRAIVISNVQRSLAVASIPLALMCLTACGGGGDANPTTGRQQPAGFVYVATVAAPDASLAGAVLQYAIGTDGSLTSLSTTSIPAGPDPIAMASDPTGHYVYVANQGDGTISQYSAGAGGLLSALSPATVSIGAYPPLAGYTLSVSPNGHALYVLGSLRDSVGILPATFIIQYAIGTDGTLSPLNPSFLTVASTGGRGSLTFDPGGAYAYLASTALIGVPQSPDGAVLQFSVAGGGELTAMPSQTVVAPRNAVGVAISPSGRTAYVLSACTDDACDGEIAVYGVGARGMLTPTGATVATPGHVIPLSLVPDTSGSSAYLLTNLMGIDTNAGAVYQYTIDNAGALVAATPPSLNVSSGAVTQFVFGPDLYALSSNATGFASGAPTGGHIDRFHIGTGGLLSTAGSISISAGYPIAMTVVAGH
ncbi:MAG TPA: beta-propeller fold lactonase family protein, partial [Steroidobacteraceae bacterium]